MGLCSSYSLILLLCVYTCRPLSVQILIFLCVCLNLNMQTEIFKIYIHCLCVKIHDTFTVIFNRKKNVHILLSATIESTS